MKGILQHPSCNSQSCDLHNLSNAGHDIIGFPFTNVNSDTTHMTPTCHTVLPITNYLDSFNYIIASAANYSECSQLIAWQLSEVQKTTVLVKRPARPTVKLQVLCLIWPFLRVWAVKLWDFNGNILHFFEFAYITYLKWDLPCLCANVVFTHMFWLATEH